MPTLRRNRNMRVVEKALTFDDVLLVPAHSTILPREVALKTQLTRGISLNIPVAAAAMDTVTEARLAIAIAQEGGIGIVHKNMSPKAQAAEGAKVKRYESGVLRDPITITPNLPLPRRGGAGGARADRPPRPVRVPRAQPGGGPGGARGQDGGGHRHQSRP